MKKIFLQVLNFFDEFISNNINNCILIIDSKNTKLNANFSYSSFQINSKIIIKLKQMNKISNKSHMLDSCFDLISLDDFSEWDSSEVIKMS